MNALDECPLTGDWEKLLPCIKILLDRGSENVHILATSRPKPDIQVKLVNAATACVDIEKLVANDIREFVQTKIAEDHKLSRWGDDVKSPIEDTLLNTGER